jgi:hypothetical protein
MYVTKFVWVYIHFFTHAIEHTQIRTSAHTQSGPKITDKLVVYQLD